MAVCIDTTGFIYLFLQGMTQNVTGSYFLSTMIISIFLIVIAAAFFRMPIEYTIIVLLPLHLAFLACIGTDWLGLTGTFLIYLGVLLGKNFFFR